jgi:C-terminal processing protease CtpA/Prc/Tol biopolymer transport system component
MKSGGSAVTQHTFNSVSDNLTGVFCDRIFFTTDREFAQVEWEPELAQVGINGGPPEQLLTTTGRDARLSPNGRFVALTKGSCRIAREAYSGSANRDVWVYDTQNDTYHQITTDSHNDFNAYWINDTTLIFQSGRTKKYNLYSVTLTENGEKAGAPKALTDFETQGLFEFSYGGGMVLAMQRDRLLNIDPNSGAVNEIAMAPEGDRVALASENKSFSSNANQVVPSPKGKMLAFEVRGEIFVKKNDKEIKRSVNISRSPYRDVEPQWLDKDHILFVSDREGQKDIYMAQAQNLSDSVLYRSLRFRIKNLTNSKASERDILISPDGKKIAYSKDNQLIVADIGTSGLRNAKVLLDHWDQVEDLSWSPDSQWLAYSHEDLNFNAEVYIHKADGSQARVNVSMHPKGDIMPRWSPDGSKLGFSSNRNNSDYDVWFTWLKKSDWEKTGYDWEDEPEADKKDKDKKVNVQIDFEDIYKRQEQITSYTEGEFIRGFSKDGKTLYYTTGNWSRGNAKVDSDLYSISWEGKDRKAITEKNARPRGVVFDAKNENAYYLQKGGIKKLKLDGAKVEGRPFTAKMKLDYKEEEKQLFEEAWAALDQRFYDPNFHGRDWDALKEEYRPLAMKASTRTDFVAIFNWMLGQINASHMGMYNRNLYPDIKKVKTGQLGAAFKNVPNGLSVVSVSPNTPADRIESKLLPGDIIKEVNGEALTAQTNIFKLLEAQAGEKVILKIQRQGVNKELVIEPTSSTSDAKYEAWVSQKRKLVDTYSNGRLGYLHIEGMNWTSFERFERELMAAGHGKEGIVIDVRYNGGGWTTDYLMAVLNVQQHAYTVPRGAAKDLAKEQTNFKHTYPFSERLPLASWTKPSIALCNQNSYSNAEIFSHAYQNLEIGKLVGNPTFGAVISTGGQGLIDGSYVRIPFRGWYNHRTEKNMDFVPAIPDITVLNAPDEKAKNTDSQLKRAVDELLADL